MFIKHDIIALKELILYSLAIIIIQVRIVTRRLVTLYVYTVSKGWVVKIFMYYYISGFGIYNIIFKLNHFFDSF